MWANKTGSRAFDDLAKNKKSEIEESLENYFDPKRRSIEKLRTGKPNDPEGQYNSSVDSEMYYHGHKKEKLNKKTTMNYLKSPRPPSDPDRQSLDVSGKVNEPIKKWKPVNNVNVLKSSLRDYKTSEIKPSFTTEEEKKKESSEYSVDYDRNRNQDSVESVESVHNNTYVNLVEKNPHEQQNKNTKEFDESQKVKKSVAFKFKNNQKHQIKEDSFEALEENSKEMQSEPSNKGLNSLHRQNKSDEEEDESDDESEPRNIFRADSRARIKPANSYDRDSKEHSTETRPEQPTNEFESTVRSGNDRKSLMKDQMVVKSYSDDEEDLDLDESDDS